MFTEIMERNKSQLAKSGSYLSPQIDKMIGLMRRLECTAGDDFYKSIHYKKFAKGDFLLKEGEPCKQIWFLESGIARKFMNRNGAELIGSFYFPGEFIVSNIVSDMNSPSKLNIQFESTATVYSLHLNCLERLKITYPVLNEIEKLGYACRAGWVDEHTYFLHFRADQRYNIILMYQSVLLHCIPLKHIASYLRMTPERLSRIRASIKKNLH